MAGFSSGVANEDVRARHLAAVVASTSDAVISYDLEGRILSWNPGAERLYGYREHEVLGLSIAIVVPPDHESEVHGILSLVADGTSMDGFETMRLHKDGHLLPVSLTASPVRDDDGVVVAASIIARDIRRQREHEREMLQLREELQRSERVQAMFMVMGSHELRTPLTSVLGYASLLADAWEELSEETRRESAAVIDRQARRLARLVANLETAARLYAGTFDCVSTPTVFGDAVDRARRDLAQPGTVTIPDQARHAVVAVAAPHLEHMLANLLSNAFTHGAPPVEVDAHVGPGLVDVCVSDGGPGIEPALVPRLFQPFAALEVARSSGFGLSLSVVKMLAEAYGGSAWYDRRHDRTTFGVTLPAAD